MIRDSVRKFVDELCQYLLEHPKQDSKVEITKKKGTLYNVKATTVISGEEKCDGLEGLSEEEYVLLHDELLDFQLCTPPKYNLRVFERIER